MIELWFMSQPRRGLLLPEHEALPVFGKQVRDAVPKESDKGPMAPGPKQPGAETN
jgi:hypothetical protein